MKENRTLSPTSLCVSFLIGEINSSNKLTELLTTYVRLCTRTEDSTVGKIDTDLTSTHPIPNLDGGPEPSLSLFIYRNLHGASCTALQSGLHSED